MANLTVRDVPDDQKEALARIAKAHGRSMEAHLRVMIERETNAPKKNVEASMLEIRKLAQEHSGWGDGEPWDREKLYKDAGR